MPMTALPVSHVGQPLSVAADALCSQIKQIADYSNRLKYEEPVTPEKSEELKNLLDVLEGARGNIKMLFATTNVRLESLDRAVRVKLMEQSAQ
jgi:hypothetical protein